jgi:hypothetical protein
MDFAQGRPCFDRERLPEFEAGPTKTLQSLCRVPGADAGRHEQGQWKEHQHNLRLSDLWRREYFAPDSTPYSGKLRILWQDSSATLQTEDAGPVRVTFYRIEVAREDLLKLLPKGYDLPQQQPAPGDPDVQISRFRFFMGEPHSEWCNDGQFGLLAKGDASQRKRGGGRSDQYNWDLVFAQFLRLLDDEGRPEIRSYRKFAKKVCDACASAGMTDDKIPSEDRVREKLSVWCGALNR